MPEIAEYEERGLALLEKHKKQLINIANKGVDYFFQHRFKEHVIGEGKKRHIFIDNGGDVLAVAHLDTVIDPVKKGFSFNHGTDKNGNAIVKMTTCDDRLGLFIILYVLPELGINADILLTDLEERSDSTAQWFEPPEGKQYNHIVQFDRAGTSLSNANDVVTYVYKDKVWDKALTDSGFKSIGQGTFTDICELQKLKTKAMNVGIGYNMHHSPKAFFVVGELMYAIERYKAFYDMYKGKHFEHKIVKKTYTSYTNDWIDPKIKPWAVVMTSAHGRIDKRPAIGHIGNNYRDNTWLIIGENGFVVDTITRSTQIIKEFVCPNCKKGVFHTVGSETRWHIHNSEVFCGVCWSYCQSYDDDVLSALMYKQEMVLEDDIFSVHVLDADKAIVELSDRPGELHSLAIEDVNRATIYTQSFAFGDVVVIDPFFLDKGVESNVYEITSVEGADVSIRKTGTPGGQEYIVPAQILTKRSLIC